MAWEGVRPYHPMVQHTVQQGSMVVVLAVQVLTHNLDVGLLAHLLRGLHSKTDVASGIKKKKQGWWCLGGSVV